MRKRFFFCFTTSAERNVEQPRLQMLQEEKDNYKAELRIYMKERLRANKAKLNIDISIKKLEEKMELL